MSTETEFTPTQDAALKTFEEARKEWKQVAFGHEARTRQHRALADAYFKVREAGIADALTGAEKLDALHAGSYL